MQQPATQQTGGAVDDGVFRYFDLFRFVAAALVVVSHARDLLLVDFGTLHAPSLAMKAIYFITGLGHESVVVFFVLSGFWISSSIDRRQHQPGVWANYAIDRMARLYIVLIPGLLLTLLWDTIGIHLLHSPLYDGTFGPNSLKMRVADLLGPVPFLGNALFLQTILVKTYGSNGPLWSLANEFWYYVAYPGLFLLLSRRKLSLWLLAVGLILSFPALATGWVVWLMGVALYYATRRMKLDAPQAGWGQIALLGVALAAVVGSLALSRSGAIGQAADPVIGVCFTACLWQLLRCRLRFHALLAPLADFGSHASFTLYLCHYPFVALLVAGLLRASSGRLQPTSHALELLLAIIGAALVYSLAVAWCAERNTPKLRRWARQRLLGA